MANFQGGPISVTSARATLTTLLGLSPSTRLFFSAATLRADRANSKTVWVGKDDVTISTNQMGYIDAGEAISISEEYLNTDQISLICESGTQTIYALLVVR